MAAASPRDIVIAGASLAGLRAAEGLRAAGYDGRLHLVGKEERPPYNRPPLSKDLLTGKLEPADTVLHGATSLDADWHLGDPAVALDTAARRVRLSSGQSLRYDALLIATGVRPRWPRGIAPRPRVLALRTLDDALALSAALRDCRRLVVLGAGFIGCEVAASARTAGVEVALVDSSPAPLARVLGDGIAAVLTGLHAGHGVATHFGVGVAGLLGGDLFAGVRLADGTEVWGDLMVVGTGAEPCTDWLGGSGLLLDDGVVCDATLRALTADGTPADGIWTAGDVARWPHPLLGMRTRRVEHWTNAALSGLTAAGNMLGQAEAASFTALPEFWSDQYDVSIRGLGYLGDDCEIRVEEGSPESRRFVASYTRDGLLAGALAFGPARALARWRGRIGQAAPAPLS